MIAFREWEAIAKSLRKTAKKRDIDIVERLPNLMAAAYCAGLCGVLDIEEMQHFLAGYNDAAKRKLAEAELAKYGPLGKVGKA